MAAPEVDKRLLDQLQEMGFSLACATRALHFSGNTSLEDAIDWIIDHENDSDIDQIPLVPLYIDLDSSKPCPITEAVKIRAQKLRDEAAQLRKEKEKELEREREREKEKEKIQVGKESFVAKQKAEESVRKRMISLREADKEDEGKARKRIRQDLEEDKERIQAGKKILEAKQNAEESARKRMIALREAIKEEERKARERIRQELEADKAERRAKLGIPLVFSPSVQPACHAIQKKSAEVSKPVKFTEKAELLNDCLRGLKRYHKDEDARVKKALQTLQVYTRNVMNNPDVEKYRNIRLNNPAFQERIGSLKGGIKFLELCGFQRINKGQFLYLPREKIDLATLTSAMSALQSALTNPFFGLLSVELP